MKILNLISGRKKYYFLLAAIAVAGIVFVTVKNNNGGEAAEETEKIYEVSTAPASSFKKNNSSVIAVGEVESLEQVDLKSQMSAEIKRVYVKIGDKVKSGQLLAELDHSSIDAQLGQAKASIDRAQSSLSQRVAGATDEEIDRARKAVEQSEAGLEQTKTANDTMIKNLEQALALAKTNLDNSGNSAGQAIQNANNNYRIAIKNSLPNVWTSLTYTGSILGKEPGDLFANDSYDHMLGAANPQTRTDANRNLSAAKSYYDIAEGKIKDLSETSPAASIESAGNDAAQALNKTKDALKSTRQMLDNTPSGSNLNEAALSGMKSQVDSYLSVIGGQISGLESAKQAITSAKLSDTSSGDVNKINYDKALNDLEQGKKQAEASLKSAEAALSSQVASYNSLVAAPRDVDLSGMEASVKEARAAHNLILVSRDKAFIRAPFAGTISALPVKNHDLVSPGQALVSLVNMEGLQLSAYISEKDRQTITEGDEAVIEGKTKGIVSRISPSLDPLTKKVEVALAITDEKPNLTVGQSAEATITAKGRINSESYLLPLKTVTITQNESYVFLLNGDTAKKALVKTGDIEGSIIEITGGLADDDVLISEGNRNCSDGDKVRVANK